MSYPSINGTIECLNDSKVGVEAGDSVSFAFSLTKEHNFYEELGNWIGDVFYDILPEKGFDLRDEQIFMAFQLERAFKEKV